MSLSTTIWELVSCSASRTEPGHNGLESEAPAPLQTKTEGQKGQSVSFKHNQRPDLKLDFARAATAGRAPGGRGASPTSYVAR